MSGALDAFRLDDKAACLTGAASGIGRAAAAVLAEAGASVVLGDLDATGVQETAKAIGEAGDGSIDQPRYDAFVERRQSVSPIGRVGEAIDQALLILYLASDASRFCTGQI